MVNNILKASGVPYRRGRFTAGKEPTYAVYTDDKSTDGSDGAEALVIRHDITVEMYEDKPDDVSESAMEAAITAAGLQWTKQDRYWLQTEQQYQVVYEFYYFEKVRI